VDLVQSLVTAGASTDHRYLGMNILDYALWCSRRDLMPLLKRKLRRRALRCTWSWSRLP